MAAPDAAPRGEHARAGGASGGVAAHAPAPPPPPHLSPPPPPPQNAAGGGAVASPPRGTPAWVPFGGCVLHQAPGVPLCPLSAHVSAAHAAQWALPPWTLCPSLTVTSLTNAAELCGSALAQALARWERVPLLLAPAAGADGAATERFRALSTHLSRSCSAVFCRAAATGGRDAYLLPGSVFGGAALGGGPCNAPGAPGGEADAHDDSVPYVFALVLQPEAPPPPPPPPPPPSLPFGALGGLRGMQDAAVAAAAVAALLGSGNGEPLRALAPALQAAAAAQQAQHALAQQQQQHAAAAAATSLFAAAAAAAAAARAYCASAAAASAPAGPAASSAASAADAAARGRGRPKNAAPACCRVPGCAVLLPVHERANARIRLCTPHMRADAVLLGDVPHRFCQQCNRLEPLAAFSGEKRTCTLRLHLHNERRRARYSQRVRADAAQQAAAGVQPLPPQPRAQPPPPPLVAQPAPPMLHVAAADVKLPPWQVAGGGCGAAVAVPAVALVASALQLQQPMLPLPPQPQPQAMLPPLRALPFVPPDAAARVLLAPPAPAPPAALVPPLMRHASPPSSAAAPAPGARVQAGDDDAAATLATMRDLMGGEAPMAAC
jgi:hypothetical protein